MELLQTLLLALVQGITEFLPISSSAHLILPFEILGWPDQGLAFDVAVHLGTLIAVVVYFWSDLMQLLQGFFLRLRGQENADGQLAINLIVASLPIVAVGFTIKSIVESELRSAGVIAMSTIIFGVVLYLADRFSQRQREASSLNVRDALLIGAAQCLALIPGTSRSGITMSAALMLGYQREAASRISFLLAIPTILGASVLLLADLAAMSVPVDWSRLGLGLVVSAVTAYLCIRLFLTTIERIGFMPFVIYRLALGFGLAWFIYF
ncbi:MAG: undecaprenyl-diphosphate phosphatase [Pseudomonadales bacterium]